MASTFVPTTTMTATIQDLPVAATEASGNTNSSGYEFRGNLGASWTSKQAQLTEKSCAVPTFSEMRSIITRATGQYRCHSFGDMKVSIVTIPRTIQR